MTSRIQASSLSVLVADDDYYMRQLIAMLLKQAGHSGVIVDNGSLALACLAQREFDVLLLDVMMPEMDGLETLASIRHGEKKSRKHQYIIMVTGHAEPSDVAHFKYAGADGCVSKPINAAQLHQALARVTGINQFFDRIIP